MSIRFAYISNGELHLNNEDGESRLIESKFGQSIRDRAVQIHDRNAWKMQGSGARFMTGGMLWGGAAHDPSALRIAIRGISKGCASDELLYALDTPEIGGIFKLSNGASEEQRLLHTADFRVRHLSANRNSDRIACVIERKAGNSCIAIMHGDGSEMTDVTQGDAVDDSPCWVPNATDELVFQSAAIGRDQNGFAAAQGPFTIHKLNIDRGEVATLAEDPKFDFVNPRVVGDGTLYYIRRPYRDPNAKPGFLRGMLDLLLLPFRLLYAVFQFLNFFTVRYTGNTLTNAGGARQKHADLRQMMIWGNLIDAQKAAENGRDAAGALVPKSWELIRQTPGGGTDVVARNVLSFDLCQDGSILYSNGAAIHQRTPQGQDVLLTKANLIEQVIAVD